MIHPSGLKKWSFKDIEDTYLILGKWKIVYHYSTYMCQSFVSFTTLNNVHTPNILCLFNCIHCHLTRGWIYLFGFNKEDSLVLYCNITNIAIIKNVLPKTCKPRFVVKTLFKISCCHQKLIEMKLVIKNTCKHKSNFQATRNNLKKKKFKDLGAALKTSLDHQVHWTTLGGKTIKCTTTITLTNYAHASTQQMLDQRVSCLLPFSKTKKKTPKHTSSHQSK